MNEENSLVQFERWFEKQKVSEFEGVNSSHVYEAWLFQQTKIEEKDKEIQDLKKELSVWYLKYKRVNELNELLKDSEVLGG